MSKEEETVDTGETNDNSVSSQWEYVENSRHLHASLDCQGKFVYAQFALKFQRIFISHGWGKLRNALLEALSKICMEEMGRK